MALNIIAYETSNLSIYQNSKIWTTDITHKGRGVIVIYFKREKEECKIPRAFLRKENLGHFDISAGPNSELVLMKDLVSEKLFLTIF